MSNGGALTPSLDAQVVIRERVEIAPAGVPFEPAASVTSEPPEGFGFLTLRAKGTNPVSYGVPIGAFFYVSTTRPGSAGPDTLIYTFDIGDGFVPIEDATGSPYQQFHHSWQATDGSGDGRLIGSEPFAPGERVIDAAFVVGPQIRRPWGTDPIVRTPWDDDFGATLGCSPGTANWIACADAWPHAMKYANFGVSVEMDGIGRATVIGIPDEVECGTTVPARILRVRGSGALGWWPHEGEVRLQTQSTDLDWGSLHLGTQSGHAILATYGEMLTDMTYQAAPCAGLDPNGEVAFFEAAVFDGGTWNKNVRTVHVAELIVSPEILQAGESASIALATTLPQHTPVSLSVDPDVGGFAGPPAVLGKAGEWQAASSNPATLSTTVAGLADVTFVAADDLTEAVTAEVLATVGNRTVSDEVTVESSVPVVRFIRQDNTAFPAAADSCLMISRIPPTRNLPDTATFDGPVPIVDPADPSTFPADPYTFRVEVGGTGVGDATQFDVVVNEGPGQFKATYGAVTGTGANGLALVRTDEHFRFASNGVPAFGADPAYASQHPSQIPSRDVRYDDQYQSDQTLLVRLGDTVIGVVRDASGSEIGRTVIQTIGCSSQPTSHPQAILTGDVHIRTYQGLGSNPAVMIEKASEDWAQAAVQFRLDSAGSDMLPMENVLRVSGKASVAGTLEILLASGLHAGSVSLDVAENELYSALAERIAAEISALEHFEATAYDFRVGPAPDSWVIVVNPGVGALIKPVTAVDDLVAERLELAYPGDNDFSYFRKQERAALAANYRSTEPGVVSALVVHDDKLGLTDPDETGKRHLRNGLWVRQGDHGGAERTLFLREEAMNGLDASQPFTFSHELGHALGLEHVDPDGVNLIDRENLMFGLWLPPYVNPGQLSLYEAERYAGRKRISGAYTQQIRDDRAVINGAPVLDQ